MRFYKMKFMKVTQRDRFRRLKVQGFTDEQAQAWIDLDQRIDEITLRGPKEAAKSWPEKRALILQRNELKKLATKNNLV